MWISFNFYGNRQSNHISTYLKYYANSYIPLGTTIHTERDKWDKMNNKNKQIYPVYVVLDKRVAKFLTTIRKQIFQS